MYIFLTTNARLALSRPHALRDHVGKVTRDIDGSTDPVSTKRKCKENQTAFTKKKKKGKTTMPDDFFFNQNTHTKNQQRMTFPL